ncbi:hypothetical protein A3781_20520 [Bacillus badius]|nr:hypothetical protein A3781_20520 [Bacillus badius]
MKQQETVFEGEFALDKQTIILLDYIENEINDTENEINDYLGASFTNSTSDKVKSVRLRGSNLLESYEVADRVRNGDKMKSVRFQLRKKITEDRYLIPTINIDFDEPLKITFGNVDNASYIPVIIDHLRTALERSLSKTYRESEVITRIQGILHRARLKDSIVIHSIIAKVKDEVLTSDISDKELFIDILDRYLIGGE